jgi:anti-anti-sigma factor
VEKLAGKITYSVEDRDTIKMVNISGDISTASKEDFTNIMNQFIQKHNVIINLRDVSLITSSGLDALINISVSARQKKKRVFIMGLKRNFLKMIDILDVNEYFIFVDNIEEAQMKLRYYT